ncbi:molybdopterin-dependent oxidoreductase [Kribbella sp. CA-247076]|uniref:molybdopterin-dependent oxidoreductase n=1 Tax=Kribbella sp. CA-247076 TaxID=3239941 RepID=UPI003D8A42BF
MGDKWKQGVGGAVGGVVAAGAALGVGYLASAVTGGPWPVDAVGVQVIDWAPGPVKDFAVRELGTADRPLLRFGICVVLALVAGVAGAIGRRRPRVAVVIAFLLGLVGLVFAVLSRSAAAGVAERFLPAIVTLVVAVVAMALVVRAQQQPDRPNTAQQQPDRPTSEQEQPERSTTAPEQLDRPEGEQEQLDRPTSEQEEPDRPTGEREQPEGFDRRRFLVTVSGLAVVGAGAFATTQIASFGTGEAARAKVRVPRPQELARPVPAGAQVDVPGVSRFVTPNSKFYRVDTLLEVPRIDPDDWELRVHGMVENELRLSFADLLDRRLIERDITLTCVSNEVGGPYVGNARWIGVPLADILAEAGVRTGAGTRNGAGAPNGAGARKGARDGADAVKSTSIDGLTIGTPLSALTDGRDAILAVAMNGEPLPFEHGFPVRMVVPGLYGYVSATKWVVDLEVTRFQDFSAYWTDRGWAVEAPIKTSSRIDVPRGFATVKAGPAIAAGVAWAQHRGIAKVEVRVDDGPWQPAVLAAEDSIDTWRQWRFRWTATPGTHKLTVRATDADGNVQSAASAPPRPNGSSGLHNTVVMVD